MFEDDTSVIFLFFNNAEKNYPYECMYVTKLSTKLSNNIQKLSRVK
jgi:hypothetical protein